MNFAAVLLWLLVINLGIVFGAGLYEARIVVPLWASSPPDSLRSPDSGRRFWAFVTTIPLTLLTLASLVATGHAQGPRRDWWLTAALVILVERLATFSYFIPTMLRLHRAAMPRAEITARLTQWARLNYLRSALTLIAWVARASGSASRPETAQAANRMLSQQLASLAAGALSRPLLPGRGPR